MNNTDWQNQRVKRIREWAYSYELDEKKIRLIDENFLVNESESNDEFINRMHQLIDTEIKSFKKVDKDRLIDPASGEKGRLAREKLREQEKYRSIDDALYWIPYD